jgi:hypothetical protein
MRRRPGPTLVGVSLATLEVHCGGGVSTWGNVPHQVGVSRFSSCAPLRGGWLLQGYGVPRWWGWLSSL